MILRFILHIEWHRGYWPRISIKRAPYPGQIIYDRGWGYRKLVPCEPCSGVGYFDAPVLDAPATRIEQNHAADEDPSLGVLIEPLRAPETPGLYRLVRTDQGRAFELLEPAQGQHGPVYDAEGRSPSNPHFGHDHSPSWDDLENCIG